MKLSTFDSAIALMPIPGERITLKGNGFEIPAIFFRSGQPGPRPTLLLENGFDGSQEEMYHVIGVETLNRGMNVITYEGLGQLTVRRQQGLSFIPEWEDVVSPVIDYVESLPEIDG
ncbi:hypothetical protein F4804DRAFT_215929 [Jackrogersella minutella]|nr:hypothetical protein F4804DRAFT_215929 [Jackrogersella minutella]